ncbi:heat shock protein transcriptional repressor HspR [Cellulomonas citrea]|uniref:heat shock protein transcriptional repressor HspR n=1 Tax=Cellulomonas citrea TaxID=1909423 RepID=UPI001358FDC9|nr:helix-turn-helix transcriptional regulator [Cellulomonas citrea]
MDEDAPLFVISVAAQMAGMHPQTLRQYDRLGLVSPGRARGRGRRYSLREVATLREVQRLSQDEGVNLAGIKRILELEAEVRTLQRQVDFLRTVMEPGRRVFAASATGDVEAVRPGARTRSGMPAASALVPWMPRQLTHRRSS